MKTYSEAKAMRDAIEAEVVSASAKLNAFPKGPFGMTPENVKFTDEFRAAKTAYDRAFAKFRKFNAAFVKAFKKEIQSERRNRNA